MKSQMTYKELADFVYSSRYRRSILAILAPEGLTPTEAKEELDAHPSQISKALKELKDVGLVTCATPRGGEVIYIPTHRAYKVDKIIMRTAIIRASLEIKTAFDDHGIFYESNRRFDGETASFFPEISVPLDNGRSLAVKIFIGRPTRKKPEAPLEHLVGVIERLVYRCNEAKELNDVEVALFFSEIARAECHGGLLEWIEKLIRKGYFGCVFFADELDKLVFYIESLVGKE